MSSDIAPNSSSLAGGERRIFLLAIVLGALCSVAFQGSRGLFESTEGRYVLCARETLDSGQFLEPMLNGEHHWTKPPLTYAAIAAGLVCFGDNAWGARIFLSIAFILTVLAVYAAGRAMWDRRTGALSAIIYATSPFTLGAAYAVSTDTLLVCFHAAATACFWFALRRRQKRYMVAMWAALGLAALTKGPLALVPLAGFIPAYWVSRRNEPSPPSLFSIPGLLLFAVLGLGWYILEIARHPELLQYWVMHETIGRIAENEYQRNPEFRKIFTIYPPVLLVGTGPWLAYLLLKWKQGGLSVKTIMLERTRSSRAQWYFLTYGILIPFVVFTLSTSRLSLYVLPLFIPITLALGKGLTHLLETKTARMRTVVTVACITALILISAKGVFAALPNRNNMAQLAEQIGSIIEEHPDRPLYVLYKEPLNGLEFYLHRPIRCIDPELAPPAEAGTDSAQHRLPGGAFVLMRTKWFRLIGPNIAPSLFEERFQNKHWTLLETKQAIHLDALRPRISATPDVTAPATS